MTPQTGPLAYRDFDIVISGEPGGYRASVINSPEGEAEEALAVDLESTEFERLVQATELEVTRSWRRRGAPSNGDAGARLGTELFRALLSGNVLSLWDSTASGAHSADEGVRLRLRIEPPELARLPWEFLYDPRRREFLARSRHSPIVRYLQVPQSIDAHDTAGPLRILCLGASPRDMEPVGVEEEQLLISEALGQDARIDFRVLRGSTFRDLQEALREGPWHVLHFIGHGEFDERRREGSVFLTDEHGRGDRISASDLADLVADHHSLRLVVLNSCEGAIGATDDEFTGTAATLVQRGVSAVLAMQYPVTVDAATEMSRELYRALAGGWPVEAAVAEARKSMRLALENSLEWATPVLYSRSRSGVLFRAAGEALPVSGDKQPAPALPQPAGAKAGPSDWNDRLRWKPLLFAGTAVIGVTAAVLALVVGSGSLSEDEDNRTPTRPPTEMATATASGVIQPPTAPDSVEVRIETWSTTTCVASVIVTWRDNSSNEDGFVIGPASLASAWKTGYRGFLIVAPNVTSARVQVTLSGDIYPFFVFAFRGLATDNEAVLSLEPAGKTVPNPCKTPPVAR